MGVSGEISLDLAGLMNLKGHYYYLGRYQLFLRKELRVK